MLEELEKKAIQQYMKELQECRLPSEETKAAKENAEQKLPEYEQSINAAKHEYKIVAKALKLEANKSDVGNFTTTLTKLKEARSAFRSTPSKESLAQLNTLVQNISQMDALGIEMAQARSKIRKTKAQMRSELFAAAKEIGENDEIYKTFASQFKGTKPLSREQIKNLSDEDLPSFSAQLKDATSKVKAQIELKEYRLEKYEVEVVTPGHSFQTPFAKQACYLGALETALEETKTAKTAKEQAAEVGDEVRDLLPKSSTIAEQIGMVDNTLDAASQALRAAIVAKAGGMSESDAGAALKGAAPATRGAAHEKIREAAVLYFNKHYPNLGERTRIKYINYYWAKAGSLVNACKAGL